MVTLILRRIALSAVTLLIVSLIVFSILEILPGDVASRILGRDATPEALTTLRTELGLDRPAALRYLSWLGGLVTGDLGKSLVSSRSVTEILSPRIFNTVLLSFYAFLLYVPLTVIPATIQALRRDRPADHALSIVTLVLLSMPDFLLATILLLIFVVALPLLDCFLDGNGAAMADGTAIPTRFGTFFWGCGLTKVLSQPKIVGLNYEDTPQLASLRPFKAKFNYLTGYRAFVDAKPNIQHWSGNAAISTGIAPSNDMQFDAETVDQTIAKAIGNGSRFRSIEIACSGNKRESYSSLGGANANPPEVSPTDLYTRLFGPGFQDGKGDWKPDPEVMLQQSVLSVVAEDRKRLMDAVGASDRARLEQYFTSVRELENTMAVELKRPEIIAEVTIPGMPEGMTVNKSVPVLLKTTPVFSQLLAIGLATNQTRVFNMALTEPANTMFMPGDSHVFHQATH